MTIKLFSNKLNRIAFIYLNILLLSNPITSFAQTAARNDNYYHLVGCDSTIWMCREEPWVLIFEDNFDGNSLNTNDWDICVGVPRDPYFESQKAWHQKENIDVSNGSLKIITRREYMPNMQYPVSYDPLIYNISDFDYTSGEIWSKRKFLFGKYEARVKIPKGWGLWPAFWLYGNGHDGNEVDIFEYWNEDHISDLSKIQHMTVHYDYDHDGDVEQDGEHYTHGNMSTDYHTYTLIYLPGYIKWLVDGHLIYAYHRYFYNTFPPDHVGCQLFNGQVYLQNLLYPFPPMSVIFNTAVQYGHGNEPNANTPLPAQMEVDWFRYYVSADNVLVQTQDIKQQYLNSEIHNGYAAYNVVLDTLTIPTDAKISIGALNEVVLRPGFEAEYGSDVDIFIHQEPAQQMVYATANQNTEELQICIQQSDLAEVSVFPNPTLGKITISCSKEAVGCGEILVYSSDGMLLNKIDITEPNTILNMNYPSGLYILAIRDNTNRISSFKIVKK